MLTVGLIFAMLAIWIEISGYFHLSVSHTFFPPACNVLYISSVEMESLTGPQAIAKAISETLAAAAPPTATVVHFKVSSQGITLTDNQRKYVTTLSIMVLYWLSEEEEDKNHSQKTNTKTKGSQW